MTPIFLLEALKEFTEKAVEDIVLEVKTRREAEGIKKRPAVVYKMNLPTKDEQVQKIPYIILQIINGNDSKESGQPEESTCTVRFVFAVFSEDAGKGAYDVLNLILRLRSELEKAGIIGEQFTLKKPLEWIVYPDNTPPYYFGEMITSWKMPIIEQQIAEYLQD